MSGDGTDDGPDEGTDLTDDSPDEITDDAEDTDGSATNCSIEEEIKIVFKGEMTMEKDVNNARFPCFYL